MMMMIATTNKHTHTHTQAHSSPSPDSPFHHLTCRAHASLTCSLIPVGPTKRRSISRSRSSGGSKSTVPGAFLKICACEAAAVAAAAAPAAAAFPRCFPPLPAGTREAKPLPPLLLEKWPDPEGAPVVAKARATELRLLDCAAERDGAMSSGAYSTTGLSARKFCCSEWAEPDFGHCAHVGL